MVNIDMISTKGSTCLSCWLDVVFSDILGNGYGILADSLGRDGQLLVDLIGVLVCALGHSFCSRFQGFFIEFCSSRFCL